MEICKSCGGAAPPPFIPEFAICDACQASFAAEDVRITVEGNRILVAYCPFDESWQWNLILAGRFPDPKHGVNSTRAAAFASGFAVLSYLTHPTKSSEDPIFVLATQAARQ